MQHVPQKCALGVPQLAAWKEMWVSLFLLSSHRLWTQPAGKDPEVLHQPLPQPWLLTAAPASHSGQVAATNLQPTLAVDEHPGALVSPLGTSERYIRYNLNTNSSN